MPRRPLDLNSEAAPPPAKRRRGPKPKPPPQIGDPFAINATEYAPPKEVKVKRHTYDTQTVVNVLQFLYYHRILDRIPDASNGEKHPRYRSGTILQKQPELVKGPEGSNMRYRSPTYEEAAAWFKIPKSTIGNWWNSRQELIKPRVPASALPRTTQDFIGPIPNPDAPVVETQETADQDQEPQQSSSPEQQTPSVQQVAIASLQQSAVAGQELGAAAKASDSASGRPMAFEEEAPSPSEALTLLQSVV